MAETIDIFAAAEKEEEQLARLAEDSRLEIYDLERKDSSVI